MVLPWLSLAVVVLCAGWCVGTISGASVKQRLDAADSRRFMDEVKAAQQSGAANYDRIARYRFVGSGFFGVEDEYQAIWHWENAMGFWVAFE